MKDDKDWIDNPFYCEETAKAVEGLKSAIRETKLFKYLELLVAWLDVKHEETKPWKKLND